jgi:hypothetical protein
MGHDKQPAWANWQNDADFFPIEIYLTEKLKGNNH